MTFHFFFKIAFMFQSPPSRYRSTPNPQSLLPPHTSHSVLWPPSCASFAGDSAKLPKPFSPSPAWRNGGWRQNKKLNNSVYASTEKKVSCPDFFQTLILKRRCHVQFFTIFFLSSPPVQVCPWPPLPRLLLYPRLQDAASDCLPLASKYAIRHISLQICSILVQL